MAKKVTGVLKLQIPAGAANPSPPVGPALGQRGINIMEFCKAFNEKTKQNAGFKIPVEISIYADKSFTFVTKQPPMSELIMKAAGLKKGSDRANVMMYLRSLSDAPMELPTMAAVEEVMEEATEAVEAAPEAM